ncbi:hypothetical protein [Shewanella halifaxensis]|uniref:hypothetical protein n=1 Tax=Shewanella halifaxensis TaxID=271098 RepID=UPI00059EC0F6|nr:hypothetical protein [Shewanella halifaxensis]
MTDNIKSSTATDDIGSLDSGDTAVTQMSAGDATSTVAAIKTAAPVIEVGAVAYGLCFIHII